MLQISDMRPDDMASGSGGSNGRSKSRDFLVGWALVEERRTDRLRAGVRGVERPASNQQSHECG